jgi:CheY-like chemotaxis protein
MSGYEVAREIVRQSGVGPRIVALSGYGHESAQRQSREAGCAQHLLKPPRLEAILAALAGS